MPRRVLTAFSTMLLGLALSITLVYSGENHFGTAQRAGIQGSSPAPVISPTQEVRDMLAQVNQARALQDLRRLTGEAPICASSGCYTLTNRLTGSEGLRWATDYIADRLVELGYSTKVQTWSRSGRTDRNVIARKQGIYAPGEEIYFVAHVDGVKKSEETFPAADDDASGTVDNLELARILSTHTFSRTIVLLFTTGEEQGTLGVRTYLDQLSPSQLGMIKYAVDVDMVGYDANHDQVMELWHGGDVPSMAVTQMMSDTIRAYQLALLPTFVVGCG